jgi:uncharacterized protein YraI
MTPIRTIVTGALAATLVVTFAAPALALEARASGNVPVHRGPGSDYRVIDRLEDGEYYEVEECTRRQLWCLVSEDDDILGWVRGSNLVGSAAKARVTPFEFLVTPNFSKKKP